MSRGIGRFPAILSLTTSKAKRDLKNRPRVLFPGKKRDSSPALFPPPPSVTLFGSLFGRIRKRIAMSKRKKMNVPGAKLHLSVASFGGGSFDRKFIIPSPA
jgi:hypothetical protein